MAEKKERNRKSSTAKRKSAESAENFSSELNAPRWSVVSFEERAAKNLTYAEAVEKLNQLAAKKVAGLCIITDEAAGKVDNR